MYAIESKLPTCLLNVAFLEMIKLSYVIWQRWIYFQQLSFVISRKVTFDKQVGSFDSIEYDKDINATKRLPPLFLVSMSIA